MNNPHRDLQDLIRQGDLLVTRYRIGRRVGAGAYGMIFRAVDETTGENVAVKAIPHTISETSSSALGRFQREMKVVRNLLHPNIISLYDWGKTEKGLIFMILEFIEGDTLDEVVLGSPLELEVAIDATRQLTEALQVAHNHGVIHRDLKPANVMLTKQQYGDYKVKVLDFGMAKMLAPMEDESIVDLTREGMAVGTPRYIAPEQARGLPVGPPADLYAVGLLLYEMLTGEQAVQANTVEAAVAAHVSREPLQLARIDDVPPSIRPLLARLLEKDPEKRVPNASELLAQLNQLTGGGRKVPIPTNTSQSQPAEFDREMLANFDHDQYRNEDFREEESDSPSLAHRILGKKEEDLDLDYDRYKAFAPTNKDPIARRKKEYSGRWFRLPRSGAEWAEAGFSVLVIPLAFIMVGAQASGLDVGPRVVVGLLAPAAALTWAVLRRSSAWEESFGRLCWIFCLASIAIAHLLGPTDLATQLTRDPTWFLRPIQDLPGVGVLAELTTFISRHWAAIIFRLV